MMTKKENHLELGRPLAVMCKTKYLNDTSEKSITYHSRNQINQALEFLNWAETLQEGNSVIALPAGNSFTLELPRLPTLFLFNGEASGLLFFLFFEISGTDSNFLNLGFLETGSPSSSFHF